MASVAEARRKRQALCGNGSLWKKPAFNARWPKEKIDGRDKKRSQAKRRDLTQWRKVQIKSAVGSNPTALSCGHLVPHVSSFSTCKIRAHQNCVKIKRLPFNEQLAFTLVVQSRTEMGRIVDT
jgi:hypothetical protein